MFDLQNSFVVDEIQNFDLLDTLMEKIPGPENYQGSVGDYDYQAQVFAFPSLILLFISFSNL
jgi:hypothetical protein